MHKTSSTPNTAAHRLMSAVSGTPGGHTRFDPLALGSLGADSRQAVVLEIGTALTKVGYAGELEPRAIIRTELINEIGQTVKIFDDRVKGDELHSRLLKFFKFIFYKYLLTVPKDRRVIIVESVLSPTSWRNAVARVLFESFDAPSLLFAPSHLLATFPFGVSDALVIDIGYSEALVVPILDGVTMLYQSEASSIGAKRLEDRAHELLHKYGKVLMTDGTERDLCDDDDVLMISEAILEDIVVRFCFVTTPARARIIQECEYDLKENVPKPPCDVRIPFGENTLIVPGVVREWTAEIIFERNENVKSIVQLILGIVSECPIDSRRKLLESLILVGGVTKMKGFHARLKHEILHTLQCDNSHKLRNINSVKFYLLPNSSIELFANWLGGSMFGALDILPYRSLTRENWMTRSMVPDWTTNVYEMNGDQAKAR